MDHLAYMIDLVLEVADVSTIQVYDVKNADMDFFVHFIESVSPLITNSEQLSLTRQNHKTAPYIGV